MYQAGKIYNAIQEMKRLNIDIMGVGEMRWPGSGHHTIDEHRVYFSGSEDGQHQNGVGLIIHSKLHSSVNNFVPISERILLLQLNSKPVQVNIIQVYAPTADSPDGEAESFYHDLRQTLRKLKRKDVTIIMGDFNAKIGEGGGTEFVGPFGLGVRNERGEMLNTFVTEEEMVILNTFFQLPARRLYTWKSPADKPDHIIRNQIDFMMVNKRYRNIFTAVKTYPGADIQSDHVPLVGSIKLKLKEISKRDYSLQYDRTKLKSPIIKELAKCHMSGKLKADGTIEDVNSEIEKLRNVVKSARDVILKPDKNGKKKRWMTDGILDLMEERRKVKDKDPGRYRDIQRQIRREIRQAKETWAQEKCLEIEDLERRHDSFNMHRKIKEVTGIYKTRMTGRLLDGNGNIIIDKVQRINTWKKYINSLFQDERVDGPDMNADSGPPITADEVRKSAEQMKDGKAPGPDDLHAEFLKMLDEDGIKWLTKLFNYIYSTGDIPRDWLKSTFIPIPKKASAKKCEDYRLISLMSHLLKLFLKIIHKRIYRRCEENISETQFGFREALGTREALFAVQVLFQRCRDVGCDVYVCLIDYQKAFDKVQHNKMIEVLRTTGIDEKDLRIIINLYWHQTASIRVEGDYSEDISIRRGVRQGCVLSPTLFNLYSEYVFGKALENVDAGVLVNGERINNIRYADDTVVFADSLEGLQELMDRIVEAGSECGLSLNIKKTKFMVISKDNNIQPGQLVIDNQQIEKVTNYTYLGTNINERWDHSVEIKCRIEKARATFVKMGNLFKSRDLNLNTKLRLLKCYVWSVLLYGVESWTLTEASTRKLEAFEMWLYRRILRISWVDHVSNKKVLEMLQKGTEIIHIIKKRKLEYFGHIMRNQKRYGLLQLILQGKVFGRRGPGRRRISWLRNLRTWFSLSTRGLFRTAVSKVQLALLIANIRNG